jgi:hypothetical protein
MNGLRVVLSSFGYTLGLYLVSIYPHSALIVSARDVVVCVCTSMQVGSAPSHVRCSWQRIFQMVLAVKILCAVALPDWDSMFVVGSAGLYGYRSSLEWEPARKYLRSLGSPSL